MILRRLESSRFSEVLPKWSGNAAVLLAGGPSLTLDQVDMVRVARAAGKTRCIAINDTYLLAPWADVHYAADAHWHRWHTDGIAIPCLRLNADQVCKRWAAFAGEKCSIDSSGHASIHDSVHLLRNAHGAVHGFGVSRNTRALVTGRNSGFQALNLAILAGATKIILLGFDGKVGADGKTHWFGDHPQPTPVAAYALYRQAMSAAERDIEAAGVEVVNCSPGSAIDSFPKCALEDVL
jgi:hypothetical protein